MLSPSAWCTHTHEGHHTRWNETRGRAVGVRQGIRPINESARAECFYLWRRRRPLFNLANGVLREFPRGGLFIHWARAARPAALTVMAQTQNLLLGCCKKPCAPKLLVRRGKKQRGVKSNQSFQTRGALFPLEFIFFDWTQIAARDIASINDNPLLAVCQRRSNCCSEFRRRYSDRTIPTQKKQ